MHDTTDTANPQAPDARDISSTKESEIAPSLAAQTHAASTGAIPRRSRAALFIQSIAAVLVVAVMAGSFYALFSSHLVRRGNGIDGTGLPGVSRTAVSLASGERVVLVASLDSELFALRAQDGALVWHYATGTTYPVVALTALDGVAYAATEYGYVTALRIADGQVLWHHDFNQFTGFPLTIWALNGVLLVPLPHSAVALRASDGAVLWRDTSGTVRGAGEGTVYINDDGVRLDSSGTPIPSTSTSGPATQTLKALRITDGKSLWTYPLHRVGESAIAAYAANGAVYVLTYYGGGGTGARAGFAVTALGASDGALIWAHEGDDTGWPFHVSKSLVLITGNGVCAFRSDTGETQWCIVPPGEVDAADDSSIYVGRYDRRASTTVLAVAALSASDGSQRWAWKSGPQRPMNGGNNRYGASIGAISPSMTVLDGVAYAGATEGVYAILGSDGHQLWHALDAQVVLKLLAANAG